MHAAREAGEAVAVAELHARRALHERLDDHGRDLGAVPRRPSSHATSKHAGSSNAGARSTGKRSGIEDVGAEAVVADRERADRVAVVRAAEREERAARRAEVRPVLERDLQRLLDRGRAVGGVEEVRVVDRARPGQRFRELDHRAVAVAEHRRVRAELELLADRVVELGDAMAERVHPQRRDRVEVAAAVDVDELVALGPVDDDRVVLGERRHLREAVPHDGGITGDPVVGSHSR